MNSVRSNSISLNYPRLTPPGSKDMGILSLCLRLNFIKLGFNLNNFQIKIWFQNRRTKWKRKYTNDLELLAQQYYSSLGSLAPRPMVLGDRLWSVLLFTGVFTTNSDILIFESLIFKSRLFHSLKYLKSTTMGCKNIGIRKSELVAKIQFLRFCIRNWLLFRNFNFPITASV